MVPECCVCRVSLDVVSDVSQHGVWHVRLCESVYQCVHVYCVECSTHVQCHCDGGCGWNGLAKTYRDSVVDVVQRCACEVFCLEPVLCRDAWHVPCHIRKNHPLECPRDNRQKGHRPALRPNVDVPVRPRDRHDVGQHPSMRHPAVVDCSAVYAREVPQSATAYAFEVFDADAVGSCRVVARADFDCCQDLPSCDAYPCWL